LRRRDFLKAASAGTIIPAVRQPGRSAQTLSARQDDRAIWVGHLGRLADPVLRNLAAGTLKARMPVEQAAGANRQT
jgi:hypothetical protein